MSSGDASLAGAEFTFRYYDGQYATAAETEASGAPTRTWAFKTNEKGRIRIMDESLKVSGDDLFYNSMGQITLPSGTLLIQETKAPEGYLIDPTVYVRNITPDGTLEAVNSYNAPTVSEQVVTGRIQIVKHTDTGTTKVETPEVGATFNIYLASAGSYDAAPANARAQLTIDKDGFAVSPDLPYGLYTVEQTSGWEGSRLMEPFTVKIDENGKTYSYIINNERFYSYLKVVKVDAITGEAIPAAGIGFQIIAPQGQKLEWWGADTWYTDGSGVMKLPCELEYGRGYQAVEVVAPSGYVLADKPFLFDVLPENAAQEDGLTVITLTAPNSPTQISVAKVDYQGNFVPGATLQLLDKDGNKLKPKEISGNYDTVSVSMPVLMNKDLPLTVSLVGGAGATEDNCVVEVEPKSIQVAGDTTVLQKLNQLVVATVDLSSFATSYEATVTIPLGNDLKNLSGVTEATVRISVRGLETAKVTATNITTTGTNRRVEIMTTSLDVTVRAPADTISQITADNVRVVVDLTNYRATSGTVAVPAKVYVDGFSNAGAIGEYVVNVHFTGG